MAPPKFSVVIPRNHANCLSKRIESVLNQTFRDFEVLYLDAKSSDNAFKIADAAQPLNFSALIAQW